MRGEAQGATGDPATAAAAIRALWRPLGRRLREATSDVDEARAAGLSLVGVGPAGVAAGLDRLEQRTRRSVWNIQRSASFDQEELFSELDQRSRARGIDERSIYSRVALDQNPLLPYMEPDARVGPFVTQLLVVDEACVVLPGEDHPTGHFTAWMSTAPQWLEPALELWSTSWSVARPFSELVDTSRLSRRQLDVAGLLYQGRTDGVIAKRLGVSARTVSDDTRRLFEVLGVGSRPELVARLSRGAY
jgi:DNA-binding CsgD family transcriptional regulator